MKNSLYPENTSPLSEFGESGSELFRQVRDTEKPLLVTEEGAAVGVILSPGEYERIMYKNHVIAAIQEGIRQANEGQLIPHEEVKRQIRKKFGTKTE